MSEANESDQMGPAVEEGFHVQDAHGANWVVRKIVEARQYALRVQAWADAELRRAKREEDFFLYRFGAQLEQWARAELISTARRRKSIALPAGKVGFCTTRLQLAIVDQDRLLAWCKSNLLDAVIVSERLSKTRLMEYVQRTGECPEGADVIPGAEKFHIR